MSVVVGEVDIWMKGVKEEEDMEILMDDVL
jgi:hypothetical protein